MGRRSVLWIVWGAVALARLCEASPKAVALLIDPVMAAAVEDSLAVYVADLQADSYRVVSHVVTETNPPAIRSYLQQLRISESNALVGAVIIGSVPLPRARFPYAAMQYEGVSMQYYGDLDGQYTLLDTNLWVFGNHSGAMESEIWISILPPFGETNETAAAIQSYLRRNHLYRMGLNRPAAGSLFPLIGSSFTTTNLYQYQVDVILGVAPDSAQWAWDPLVRRGRVLVAPDNYLDDPVRYPDSAVIFTNLITSGDYDVLVSSTHGSPWGIGMYGMDYLTSTLLNVNYWFEGGCSTCDFDIIPNFGFTALYSPTSRILTYMGATTDQGGLGGTADGYFPKVISTGLSQGKSVGEAILTVLSKPLTATYSSQREYYRAQHVLLGDGTLRLQEFMPARARCQLNVSHQPAGSQIRWNSFTGLTYTVQTSSNLVGWTDAVSLVGTGGVQSLGVDTGAAGRRFLRLHITP